MGKRLFYGDDARQRLLEGARLLYEAVKSTMGPNSGNAVIGDLPMAPRITHDGVTVSRAISITPTAENLGQAEGVELIKEASIRMNDVAGDGTTTVTVLAYHLLKEANRLITSGYNPMKLRRELEAQTKLTVEELAKISTPITDNASVEEIATISAGDPEIGKVIADIIKEIGKDGAITVEEGNLLDISSEIVDGYSFDAGYISPYFVTNQSRQEAVLNSPYILLINRRVGFEKDIFPILSKIAESGHREVLIIADAVESEALAAIVLNKGKGVINSCVVHAPGGGAGRKAFLEDVACLTGGMIIDTDNGEEVQETTVQDLGRAERVVVTKDKTTIIGGKGSVEARVEALNDQMATSTPSERIHLENRKAGLLGKVAIITVGGSTQPEIEEKKYRVDDAVCAVKAALKEGIVPGGETALLHLSKQITSDTAGAQLLKHAMEQPIHVLLDNAGYNHEHLIPQIDKLGKGIDARTGEMVDLRKEGIIDPTLVTREAILNAVSVAGTGMTMGVLVCEEPNEDR
jgi:chaperonin GroEL